MILSPKILGVLLALAAGLDAAPARTATSSSPTAKPAPPLLEDGSPRPGCTEIPDCWDFARSQCKHSTPNLLFKAYCLDEYCYVLCPPTLPTGIPPPTTAPASQTTLATETKPTLPAETEASATHEKLGARQWFPLPAGAVQGDLWW